MRCRRGLLLAALAACWASSRPALADPTIVYRLGVPVFLDDSVGRLFPDGPRLGAGADVRLHDDWSLGMSAMLLYQDWGTSAYTLALAPILVRHATMLAPASAPVRPYLSLGAGGALMTLVGGNPGLQVGVGPALEVGTGVRLDGLLGMPADLMLALQQGAVNQVHYLGLALSLGMGFGPGAAGKGPALPMIEAKPMPVVPAIVPPVPVVPSPAPPPQPSGLQHVGTVLQLSGDEVRFSSDRTDLRPGATLIIYYLDGGPVKIAKLRLIRQEGGQAWGQVLVSTDAIRNGEFVGIE